MLKFRPFVIFVFVILVVVACGGKEASKTETPIASTAIIEKNTPVIPQISPISPLATIQVKDDVGDTIIDLPTPRPGKGIVVGRIGHATEAQRIWNFGAKIYMTQLIYAKDNQGNSVVPILGLDFKEDLNEDLVVGDKFIFVDVPPGEYGFILNNPIENYPVPGSHTSGFLIVDVVSGETIDVGEVALP